MATNKQTKAASSPQSVVLVSLIALTPLRLDGEDIAEQSPFDAETSVADDLVAAGLAEPA